MKYDKSRWHDKSRWPELYLDWVNNFLTIEHFAEHYSMTVEHAKEIIEHEREKPNELVEIEIPFSGFYESIHDSNIDRALEDGFNYDYEKQEEAELTDEIRDAIWSANVNHKAIEIEYCEAFVNAFADRYELDLEFEIMTSPKEYNFATDRIFAKIKREQIDKIRAEVEAHDKWPEYIKDNFTSYDGYWANYDSDYKNEDWTRADLDSCQYGVILKFWLRNITNLGGIEGYDVDEYYLTNDFEMCNWESINNAHDKIREYIEEQKKDYSHCYSCDKAIDMDNDTWEVINDNTYCTSCAEKEK